MNLFFFKYLINTTPRASSLVIYYSILILCMIILHNIPSLTCKPLTINDRKDETVSATEKEYDTFIGHVPDGEIIILVKGDNTISREPEILINPERNLFILVLTSLKNSKRKLLKVYSFFLKMKEIISSEAFIKRINLESDLADIDENEVRDFLKKKSH